MTKYSQPASREQWQHCVASLKVLLNLHGPPLAMLYCTSGLLEYAAYTVLRNFRPLN